MARILVDLIGALRHRDADGPRPCPRVRISDRVLVLQRVGLGPGASLDEARVFRIRTRGVPGARNGIRSEVRGLDYQRVALPMTARVADPSMHGGSRVQTPID